MPEQDDLPELLGSLQSGARQLGLTLPPGAESRLLALLGHLRQWNRTYNLTSIREPEEMLRRHLLDSLAVVPHIRGNRVLDVGTGPGFPGLPLAIALPDVQFDLLDASLKKTRFVLHAAANLGLGNVSVVQQRVEKYRCDGGYDMICSRAFSSLGKLVESTAHLCADATRILALKGRCDEAELAGLPAGYRIEQQVNLNIPGLAAERWLIVITRNTP